MFARTISRVPYYLRSTTIQKACCFKVLSSGLHTADHIPMMDANMETLEITFNPRDITSHNSSVLSFFSGINYRSLCFMVLEIQVYKQCNFHFVGFFMAPYAVDLSKTLPTTRFICPTAKEIKLTCRDGAKHHAWVCFHYPYDLQFDFPLWNEEGNNKCVGVEDSCKIVNDLIQKEIDEGISPEKIIVCGFSQGVGIALHTVYGRDVPVGGIIGFCGCLPNDNKFTVNEKSANTDCL